MPVAGPSDITPTLHISDALNSLPSCCSVFAHIVSLFRRGAPVKQIVAAASLGTVRSASLSLFCARHPTLRRHLRSRSEEDRLFRGLIDGQTLRNILCVERSPCVREFTFQKTATFAQKFLESEEYTSVWPNLQTIRSLCAMGHFATQSEDRPYRSVSHFLRANSKTLQTTSFFNGTTLQLVTCLPTIAVADVTQKCITTGNWRYRKYPLMGAPPSVLGTHHRLLRLLMGARDQWEKHGCSEFDVTTRCSS